MQQIKKILFITLSNLGDVILTLPVLDALREQYPQAKVTVMVGPRPKEIFEGNPFIERCIVFDKHSKLRDKIKLFIELKKEAFDVVIDLRNSFFQFLPARYKTSPFVGVPPTIAHMKDRYLYKLQKALRERKPFFAHIRSLYISAQDKELVLGLLKDKGVGTQERLVVVSPGVGGATKKWEAEKFAQLCRALSMQCRILLIGAKAHSSLTQYILAQGGGSTVDLAGRTSLAQLAFLLKSCALLISGDTGTMQVASYFDVPIVALFGATDEKKYGPWSKRYIVVKKDLLCRPCNAAVCSRVSVECMSRIKAQDVVCQAQRLLAGGFEPAVYSAGERKPLFKRILIVRTDRVGDVLLSTPVIKALRFAFPSAYCAMMVSPYAKEIVDGNPYLDEVIAYDKDVKHKSWWRTIRFSLNLRKKQFDLAVILHPTNRVHIVAFLAGIKRRIGYDRKMSFLLTDKLPHTKQLGVKHEAEYNLDFVRYLGLDPLEMQLYMPIKAESELWASAFLSQQQIAQTDRLVALHPGASCPSKIWPQERFAELADRLAGQYGFKVLLVAGPKDIRLAVSVQERMKSPVINLAGKTSLSQLASILKRCVLFISNDSGPVHIASALGTPVISIFGRNQKGLNPTRWGPVTRKGVVLHKEIGCIECFAHDCRKAFACLAAIGVDDVLEAVDSVLKEEGRV